MIRKYWLNLAFLLMFLLIAVSCKNDTDDLDTAGNDNYDTENIEDTIEADIEPEPEVIVEVDITEVSEPEPEPVAEYVSVSPEDYMTFETGHYDMTYTPIRGIYLSAYTAAKNRDHLVSLADETEVNAFVIDVKSDTGRIMFDMDHELIDDTGAEYILIDDMEAMMDDLYAHNIYPIARIVCFKDEFMAERVPEYAIHNQDGSMFYYGGIPWLNPYNQDTWAYLLDVSKACAEAGFKEIQFDYVRFEATRTLNDADFGDIPEDYNRRDVIADFIAYAKAELEPYDVKLSADVFGAIITSEVDARTIGQDYYRMSENLDVICPMVYPSHYSMGSYGATYPDLEPYTIIYGSMMDSNEVLQDLLDAGEIVVRPWLQAFTASYLKEPNKYMVYGGEAIRAQIQGAYDAGLTEWILWNAGNSYSSNGLEGPQE